MSQSKRELHLGDVLEVETSAGYAYIQFIGKHPEYGEAIVASTRKYLERPRSLADLFHDGYVTFYPVKAALAKGLVKVVGHVEPRSMPTQFRRAGVRQGNRIESWVIENASGELVKNKLTDAERAIPIAAIWSHAMLVERLEKAWRPELVGTDG